MRRLLTFVAALAVAAATLFAAPAYATQESTKCLVFHPNSYTVKLCMDVYWHDQSGTTGIVVNQIVTWYSDRSIWAAKAFDCRDLEIVNDNAIVKWSKVGAGCDLLDSRDTDVFQPNFPDGIKMVNAASATVQLVGSPHFDQGDDPGQVALSIPLHS